MNDCGRIELDPDEQVTFVTAAGAEYDVARKSWGFYATPSTNGRLAGFGWRTALIRNAVGRFFVVLVERGQDEAFRRYIEDEQQTIVVWLDNEDQCRAIERTLSAQA